jgi:hypothetical protein
VRDVSVIWVARAAPLNDQICHFIMLLEAS